MESLEGRRLLSTTNVFHHIGGYGYQQQAMAPGVTASFQGNRAAPHPYSASPYSLNNDTVTLTLGGFQAHQMLRVVADTQYSSYYDWPYQGTSRLDVDFAGKHQQKTNVAGGAGSGAEGDLGWVQQVAGPDGTLTVTLTGSNTAPGGNLYLHSLDVYLYTPTVGLSVDKASVHEDPAEQATFDVTRDLPSGWVGIDSGGVAIDEPVPSLVVGYHMSGTATPRGEPDADYDGPFRDGTRTFGYHFENGRSVPETSRPKVLTPINDSFIENAETATMTVKQDPNYLFAGNPKTVTLMQAPAGFVVDDVVITSPARTGTATAALNRGTRGTYSIVSGSVQAGPRAPAVTGSLFSMTQTNNGSSTQTLTFTYSGELPRRPGTVFTYSMAIKEEGLGTATRIRVEIE